GAELAQLRDFLLELRALRGAQREALLGLARQRFESLPCTPRGNASGHEFFGSGVRVQRFSLSLRAQERLVSVLAVDVDEPLACFAQLRERGGPAVDERSRAAVAVDRTPQDDHALVAFQVLLGEP